MEKAVTGGSPETPVAASTGCGGAMTRKEKRKVLKKLKRKQLRKEMAIKEKEEEEARLKNPEEQLRLKKIEEEERERSERERRLFEERERLWIEARIKREEEEEAERQRKLLEESHENEKNREDNLEKSEEDNDEWEYVEEGPAEIIWKGNEIIVKKKTVKVPKGIAQKGSKKEDADRPTSNPLPPQTEAFSSHMRVATVPAQDVLNKMAQETPNFGTEQDKAHCPFHLKTGVCRFGLRCNRAHFYPENSCTLLIKNMYSGPGLAWEQDEGLEYTDEEVEHSYEEFYEDVHTEFLKFGELINFKVCRNSSYHLRGNVYVHYKSLDSAVLAYESINGRYFAGRQITCEFVSITRWKVAICGEYMKSRLKTCSRGSACNFLHCFKNPGGDYEWADWDKPPPKYWISKMVSLFGFYDESYYNKKAVELGDTERLRSSDRRRTPASDRYDSRHRKESYDHDSVRDDSDLEREHRRRKRDSSRSEKHQSRDSDRYHSTRERSYGRHESSRKHKKRSNRDYHRKDSTEDKTELKGKYRFDEAKEVSEESYGEEETDSRRQKSKRHQDKYDGDKCSDNSSESKSRRKHSTSKKRKHHREKHEGSDIEEETGARKEKSKRHQDKYSDSSSESKSRRKHSTSKKRKHHREKHEGSDIEEETGAREEKSKRHQDKYYGDDDSDNSSESKSRRKHSTSKKRKHHREKYEGSEIEEENYVNSDSSSRKHTRRGGKGEQRKKREEREEYDYTDSGSENSGFRHV